MTNENEPVTTDGGTPARPAQQGAARIDNDGRIWVDNSALKSFSKCSTQALIQYVHGYQLRGDESPYLKSGTAGHEAMAVYFKTWDAEQALQTYADFYKDWAEEHVLDPDNRISYESTSAVLTQWYADHPQSRFEFFVRPDLVEIPFAIDIADDVIFTGRMDMIAQNAQDSEWYVVDHKFTGDINKWGWADGFHYDTQISGYTYAAQRHTDRTVVGAYINAVEFSRLPKGDDNLLCKRHGAYIVDCAHMHVTKTGKPEMCRTHKVPLIECAGAGRHRRVCKEHGTFTSECRHMHSRSRLFPRSRTEAQLEEWRKTAVSQARRFRDLILNFPDINDIHRVRTQGQFTGGCDWCSIKDWCIPGRRLDLIDTMMEYRPWSSWNYGAKEG